jgi:hypothetical protein
MVSAKTNKLINALEDNYEKIRSQFEDHKKRSPEDFEEFNNGRSSGEWTSAGLRSVWGHWSHKMVLQYPTLFNLFEEHLPEVKAISINCLGPHASIGYHTGVIYQNIMYKRFLHDPEKWALECRKEDWQITPSRGKYYAYRFHYGLDVPDMPLLLGLECEGKTHHWDNGKTFMFKDFEKHRAWNETGEYRYALIFDVLKEDYEQ